MLTNRGPDAVFTCRKIQHCFDAFPINANTEHFSNATGTRRLQRLRRIIQIVEMTV
jgi:hypothetical protein